MATRLPYRLPVRADLPRLVEIRNQTVLSPDFDPHGTGYVSRTVAEYDVIDGFLQHGQRPDVIVVERNGQLVGFEGGHLPEVEIIAIAAGFSTQISKIILMSCSWAIADRAEALGHTFVEFEFPWGNPALAYINQAIPLNSPPNSRTQVEGRGSDGTPHYGRAQVLCAWIKARAELELAAL